MENKIISPCISICRTDPVTGYCYGCARTNEEKKQWNKERIKLKTIIRRQSIKINLLQSEQINKTNKLLKRKFKI